MYETRRLNLTHAGAGHRAYPAPMTLSARDIAAEIRRRLPGVGAKKLHKLLYYTQGHHLAAFGTPLFHETISAWDMGPVVGTLWYAEKTGKPLDGQARLGEAELNTIGYVMSRYGALTGNDLEHLTHSEEPWQRANRDRGAKGSVSIQMESMRDYFRTAGIVDDEEEVPLDSEAVSEFLAGANDRRKLPAQPDSVEEILTRLGRSA